MEAKTSINPLQTVPACARLRPNGPGRNNSTIGRDPSKRLTWMYYSEETGVCSCERHKSVVLLLAY